MSKPLKQIKVKVFGVGNKTFKSYTFHTPKGHHFRPGGEMGPLEEIANKIEAAYPWEEFEMKQVGRGEFNFVWLSSKPYVEKAEATA